MYELPVCPYVNSSINPLCYYAEMIGAPLFYGGITGPSGLPVQAIQNKVKKSFTEKEAINIARQLGVDFSKFDVEQFRMGLDVELEHGRRDPSTNVTGNDPLLTGKIALAHLNEFPDYYTRLAKMEAEAKEYWGMT